MLIIGKTNPNPTPIDQNSTHIFRHLTANFDGRLLGRTHALERPGHTEIARYIDLSNKRSKHAFESDLT